MLKIKSEKNSVFYLSVCCQHWYYRLVVKQIKFQNTYLVGAIAPGSTDCYFQRIGDDEIRVYRIPSHFQDSRWQDSSWAEAEINKYMDNLGIVKLKPIDNDLLNLMKAKTKMSD